jgi:hypothetical protein
LGRLVLTEGNMKSPRLIIVSIALGLGVVSLLVAGGEIVNYLLLASQFHHFTAAQHALEQKQKLASVKSGTILCYYVQQMDNASHGAVNASKSLHSYGHNLAHAIHGLYSHTGCPAFLRKHAKLAREILNTMSGSKHTTT